MDRTAWLAARRRIAAGALALIIAFAGAPGAYAKPAGDKRVDLNAASVAELVTLPGIGPRRAEAIVKRRQKRPFRTVSDLRRIKGIGRKLMAKIRPLVTVKVVKAGDTSKRPRSSPKPHPSGGGTQRGR